jgi:hypothetical protein
MCANCTHPKCDSTKLKTTREFMSMVKGNIIKEDAKKIYYYDSGQFL